MNSKNISVGDLVYIVSSTSSKVLKNLGPGIVISKTISSPNNIECLDLLYNIEKKFKDLALPILDKTTSEYSVNFVNMIRNFLYKIEEYP